MRSVIGQTVSTSSSQAALAEDWEHGGFGLYVHWPFCAAKCPYCDFNSHVTSQVDHNAWAEAYVDELKRIGAETEGRVLHSVFFGGGTPSLMEPRTVARILDTTFSIWPQANDVEVTLEANPTSVEAGKFSDFRSAGVNRVSMGVQALNDPDLKALGRLHTADEAMSAFDIARGTFDRVSFDLIYGRQNQSCAAWEAELTHALSLAVDHISLYQLTIEPQTAFGDRYERGLLRGLPDDDLSADMYEITQHLCADHGMSRYEVSNHARDGAESRHNLIYWRYGDYVGIGPGAHGRLTLRGERWATEQARMPAAWLSGEKRETREFLSRDAQAQEMMLMGLRLREGVSLRRYLQLADRALTGETIEALRDQGMLSQEGDHIIVSDQGVMILNEVLRQLLQD